MKHWEESRLLTDLLDRHRARLVDMTQASDWTIYWTLSPFLSFLRQEPVLSESVQDCVRQFTVAATRRNRRLVELVQSAADLKTEHERVLMALKSKISAEEWASNGFDKLAELVTEALQEPEKSGRAERVLECVHAWVALGCDLQTQQWLEPGLAEVSVRIDRLRNELKRLHLQFERFVAWHPGAAYLRLVNSVEGLNYVATGDRAADALHNKRVANVHGWIRETERWSATGSLSQPTIIGIQGDVQSLHLALVTSLAMGRSRWATLHRFAGLCESFDRKRLVEELMAAKRKKSVAKQKSGGRGSRGAGPESILTLALARYLFEVGYNPLVDAAACGLRPDVFDATAQPAVYVEAKQYEKVSDRTVAQLRRDLAQTLNTWARLAARWSVPEAFLLIFRRSGRPLDLHEQEIRTARGRLYILCVDLAEATESGSRAKEPVRVHVRDLMSRRSGGGGKRGGGLNNGVVAGATVLPK